LATIAGASSARVRPDLQCHCAVFVIPYLESQKKRDFYHYAGAASWLYAAKVCKTV